MKVLHVISDENIGGAGILLVNLLRHLDGARIQSRVALPKESALLPRLATIGVACDELQAPCDRISLRAIGEICRLVKAHSIDVVHANAALSARIAGRLCGVRVVHTRHCCFPLSPKPRVVRALSGWCNAALSDAVIATADAAAEDLVLRGIPRERIRVIINGASPVREVGKEELALARERWGIAPDAFCVGICARLVRCKGHETFLRAAALVRERLSGQRFCFLLAGEGERRNELEAFARTLGIAQDVRFLGFLEDTAPFYRLLRLNVNCSCGTETSCLAISEGFSAGVPVLASDYGGNPAMVGEGLAGKLFGVGNAKALAMAIAEVASSPLLEEEMRHAAYRRYQSCFSPTRMADEVTSFYESLFEKN